MLCSKVDNCRICYASVSYFTTIGAILYLGLYK